MAQKQSKAKILIIRIQGLVKEEKKHFVEYT